MMTIVKNIIFLIMVGMVLFLTACGPVKTPPIHSYTISCPKLDAPVRHTRTRSVLLVNLPVADQGYDTYNMIYVCKPFKLDYFATHRWVAPPGDLIAPLLADRIRNKMYFKAVVTSPYLGFANYRLDLRLQILQQEFLEPVSHVRLKIQALLMTADNRLIASQVFQTCVPSPGNDPYSGVLATNEAVEQMNDQIARFVIHSLK